MNVTVPGETACLSSLDNIYTIHLNLTKDGYEQIVPVGYDIIDTLVELPSEVDEIRLIIGGMNVATFTKDNIHDLRNFPIYLSKATFHNIHVQLVYNKDYLMQHEEFCMVDEMVEEEEYGDEMVEVFDGDCYLTGRIVTRVMVPSGKKLREITKKADVDIPNITFVLRESDNTNGYVEVPVRQKVVLAKNRIEHYQKKFNLEIVDESEDRVTGYVTNYIMYREKLAGLKYVFA
jgi:hypothetical protein